MRASSICRGPAAALLLLLCALPAVAAAAERARIDFERDVKPILRDHCWECHGPKESKGSLRLDRKRFALSGGDRDNIIPGAPERSRLYKAVAGLDEDILMPEDGMLEDAQIKVLHDWIAQGAQWPDDPPEQQWRVDPEVAALARRVRAGEFEAVRGAVRARPALLQARDARGTTLLAHVALYGNAVELEWLLRQKADPDIADGAGHTPLMLALDDVAKVRALLDAGANPNARTEAGRSVVDVVSDQRDTAALLRLLLAHGVKLDAEQERGLLVQVARNGDLPAMQLLVARQGGKYPPQALNAAAASNCLACVQAVLKQKPEPDRLNAALASVAIMATREVLAALLEAGADPNYREPASTRRGQERDAKTVLMKVVYSDYADVDKVQLLLERGADVNARSSKGGTALGEARRKGNASAVVALLLAAGAKE